MVILDALARLVESECSSRDCRVSPVDSARILWHCYHHRHATILDCLVLILKRPTCSFLYLSVNS